MSGNKTQVNGVEMLYYTRTGVEGGKEIRESYVVLRTEGGGSVALSGWVDPRTALTSAAETLEALAALCRVRVKSL